MRQAPQLARLELATELALARGRVGHDAAPDDTHAHGHVAGSGDPAYVLIMVGDDQRFYRRSEWDTRHGQAAVAGARRRRSLDRLGAVPGA